MREDELLVKMPQRPAARLTQRRYDDDPEVKRRAPARGQYWGFRWVLLMCLKYVRFGH